LVEKDPPLDQDALAQIARGRPRAVLWVGHDDDPKISAPIVRVIDEGHAAAKRPDRNRGPTCKLHGGPTFELEANLASGLDQSRVVPIDV
jgi:hypothetical protein